MIFVDTGAWYAAFVPEDPNHEAADAWRKGNREVLLTTDYVLSELVTLLRAKGERTRSMRMGESLFSEDLARLHWATRQDVLRAWTVFRDFADKDWSFADCVSYAVIESLGIEKAFAFDRHFRQFGTVEVVP